ncbi:NADH-quinone oxidoreductase subunit NuoH [Candidatus Kapabacteria bacterium]|nr:NADH-quinone oxidoreductase subunit NuoH [Candidatus Kapabacteria bacterium]
MSDLNSLIIEASIKGLVIVGIVQTLAAFEVWLERKISAWIQNRIGPNRVGPMGLLQPFADVVKLFMKEDLVPDAAHKGFHRLAPALSLAIATAVYAVIPYAHYWDADLTGIGLDFQQRIYFGIAPNVNIGVLFMLAMTSIGVYGITLAGWSSNSKYSLLGGLRSAAQMISYELAMGISVLAVVLWASTLSINGIIVEQEGWAVNWYIFRNPIAFFIFLICAFAETNRAPFDLPEAEPELVGGFNTEYSGMKFGMFFLAEYANMATASAFIIILFLGGWQLPFPAEMVGLEAGSLALTLAQIGAFAIKLLILLFFFVQVRWSIPRFRYDQLMNLGWKILLPLSIVNLLITAIIIFVFDA